MEREKEIEGNKLLAWKIYETFYGVIFVGWQSEGRKISEKISHNKASTVCYEWVRNLKNIKDLRMKFYF